jgi:hypothetical protein
MKDGEQDWEEGGGAEWTHHGGPVVVVDEVSAVVPVVGRAGC